MPSKPANLFSRATRPLRAFGRAMVFFLKVFPMLPSRAIDWVTKKPVIERVRYPTHDGEAEGDLYRPAGGGRHPGIVICLGVVPFEVDHPQVPVLGRALARAGFSALLYWSPAMRDFRMDPVDIENIALAYGWLIEQPNIDAAHSGMFGTCVGGSFALMAAASPRVRERIAFLGAYAPFSSMWTFARDIACERREIGAGRGPWKVDQLTRRVFVHSITAWLEPAEAERLRRGFEVAGGQWDGGELSPEGQAVYEVLTAEDEPAAEAALKRLPAEMQEKLTVMSPVNYLDGLRSPMISILHDQGDQVIPVDESRRMMKAFGNHAGVRYAEMQFQHLDPVKGKLPIFKLIRELGKFFRAVYPMFRQAMD